MSTSARLRPLALEASCVLLACLVASTLLSWPLALWAAKVYPSDPSMPDLNVALWLPHHVLVQLGAGEPLLYAPELHWPTGQDNSNLLWNLGIQLVQLPLYALLESVTAYNLSLVLLGALNGMGGWVLGRAAGGSRAAGAAAAALLMASPYAWNELIQGRAEQGFLGLVALALAGLWSLEGPKGRRFGAAVGAAWAAAGLCYWFYAYFLTLVFGCLGLWWLLTRRWAALQSLVVAGVVAALLALPAAGPLVLSAADSASSYSRSADSGFITSAATMPWTSLKLSALAWPLWPLERMRDAVPLTLSLPLVLGLLRWRRAGVLVAVGLAGTVLALGWSLHLTATTQTELVLPYAWFQAVLPGFWRLAWPYRFLSLTVVGGAGCAAVLVPLAGRGQWPVAVAIALLAGAELRVTQSSNGMRTVWTTPDRLSVSPFYRALAEEPGQHPILTLPHRSRHSAVRWVPYHRQPISEGNADMEDFGHSPEHIAWRAAHPSLDALAALGRSPGPASIASRAILADLESTGLHWAVLPAGADTRTARLHSDFFGRPPDYADSELSAWWLAPGSPQPAGLTAGGGSR